MTLLLFSFMKVAIGTLIQTHERFKRTLFIRTKTQSANYLLGRKHSLQIYPATKRHLNSNHSCFSFYFFNRKHDFLYVQISKCAWLEARFAMKATLKSAWTDSGALCATTLGVGPLPILTLSVAHSAFLGEIDVPLVPMALPANRPPYSAQGKAYRVLSVSSK